MRDALVPLTLPSPEVATFTNAVSLFRSLRRKGVPVRGAVDCAIAQHCIEADLPLLTLDRDFGFIAEHTALRLHRGDMEAT